MGNVKFQIQHYLTLAPEKIGGCAVPVGCSGWWIYAKLVVL